MLRKTIVSLSLASYVILFSSMLLAQIPQGIALYDDNNIKNTVPTVSGQGGFNRPVPGYFISTLDFSNAERLNEKQFPIEVTKKGDVCELNSKYVKAVEASSTASFAQSFYTLVADWQKMPAKSFPCSGSALPAIYPDQPKYKNSIGIEFQNTDLYSFGIIDGFYRFIDHFSQELGAAYSIPKVGLVLTKNNGSWYRQNLLNYDPEHEGSMSTGVLVHEAAHHMLGNTSRIGYYDDTRNTNPNAKNPWPKKGFPAGGSLNEAFAGVMTIATEKGYFNYQKVTREFYDRWHTTNHVTLIDVYNNNNWHANGNVLVNAYLYLVDKLRAGAQDTADIYRKAFAPFWYANIKYFDDKTNYSDIGIDICNAAKDVTGAYKYTESEIDSLINVFAQVGLDANCKLSGNYPEIKSIEGSHEQVADTFITNQPELIIKGVGMQNSTIQVALMVKDNTTPIKILGKTTTELDGTWSFKIDSLANLTQGANYVIVYYIDSNNLRSSQADKKFIYYRTIPKDLIKPILNSVEKQADKLILRITTNKIWLSSFSVYINNKKIKFNLKCEHNIPAEEMYACPMDNIDKKNCDNVDSCVNKKIMTAQLEYIPQSHGNVLIKGDNEIRLRLFDLYLNYLDSDLKTLKLETGDPLVPAMAGTLKLC